MDQLDAHFCGCQSPVDRQPRRRGRRVPPRWAPEGVMDVTSEDALCRDPVRHWHSAEFRARAWEWVQETLGKRGHEVCGELREHRVRFWSAVFTVPSDTGRLWFKATNPGQAFEAPLLARLCQLVPHDVVPPIAVDEARGWLLLPDGGQTLDARGDVTVAEWEALVVQAARMQRALAAHEVELAATGLQALAPDQAHEYAACLIEDLAQLPPEHLQHVDAIQARALLHDLARVEEPFRDLAASGVPMTLQPNDVSASNAFFHGKEGAPFRLFDFGDAFWSHPFAALQVPVRMATGAWPHPPAPVHPVRARLIRAYLEQWPQVSPDEALGRLVEAADRLACLHRCESWRRLLTHVHPGRLGITPPRLIDWITDAAREPATAETPSRLPLRP